jgi:phosphatidylserine synthase
MKQISDRILGPLIVLCHEKLGLSPNEISTAGFALGLVAAALVASGFIGAGLLIMAFSQIVDGVDGGVARRYGLRSPRGAILELLYDRFAELVMFCALAFIGRISWQIAALAFTAIILLTAVEPKSGFDPGAKRFMLYFGWFAGLLFPINGFQIAMQVIFLANLSAAAIGMVIAEYRLQREVDKQAILERERRRVAGVPLSPPDPPTILSRVFSWF